MRSSWLGLWLMAGCTHGGWHPSGWSEIVWSRWAPAAREIRYDRVLMQGPWPMGTSKVVDTWSEPRLRSRRLVVDLTSRRVSEEGIERNERIRYFYGVEGFGYLGTLDTEGRLERWEPPLVVLPPEPEVGQSWEVTHRKGGEVMVRSCDLRVSELCDDGLVVVCVTQRPDDRTIFRDHFCPDVGWSGFEAMRITPGLPAIRMWSEHMIRDGVALPEPWLEESSELSE